MPIAFSKYSGCGNDFIVIDNRSLVFPKNHQSLISQLCNRHHGIGADGVILLENSSSAPFRMRIFNADGSEAEMCGNGLRCLAKFIHDEGSSASNFYVETMHDCLHISLQSEKIAIEMPLPTELCKEFTLPFEQFTLKMHHLTVGVPHTVIFVDDLDNNDWMRLAPIIRYHESFGDRGTNVNFASRDSRGNIKLRTYERGVENETLACGTGATATALIAANLFHIPSPINIIPRSEDPLQIFFKKEQDSYTEVSLVGPARRIYYGEFILEEILLTVSSEIQ